MSVGGVRVSPRDPDASLTYRPYRPRCSFCGKREARGRKVVRREDGLLICDECVTRVLAALSAPTQPPPRDKHQEHVDDAFAQMRVLGGAFPGELPEEFTRTAVGERAGRRRVRGRSLALATAALIVIAAGVTAAFNVGGSPSARSRETLAGTTLPASGRSPASGSGARAAVAVDGFPTGIAVDPASGTVYVASGALGALSMIDANSCGGVVRRGCLSRRAVSTDGDDPVGVVVDDTTGTVYAANSGSDTVAVIDAHACNALDQQGCSKTPTLVNVPGRTSVHDAR